ncbi:winged helix-turn-helix domain-containing protein [Streptomyces sp. Z26]|uniref:winged helix-turn-helix domain-containing protein n=1 Tax=Streptomyces TaxID=1883 RepID=UPI000EF13D89|nr:winged helix-turn-helix domain-containing protein [Streptomyces sp. Z26]RLL67526.1 GntR family transcriptional regulator [Streptomyces sp. Z26]
MSPETPPGTGERPPSRDHVAGVLRGRIQDGAWGPGTNLPTQQELEAEFGVKRTVVRQALGILQREGLVTTGRGAPATVAESAAAPREAEAPRPAGVELADRVRAALQARDVTIDAFSLTTETLNAAFAGALPAMTSGELTPHSLTVRVLLPSPEARLAFPRPVSDDSGDSRPLRRSHDKMRLYATTLRDQLLGLQEVGLAEKVSVEIRTVAITPMHKLYVLNGTESLIGYYRLIEHSVEIDNEEMEIYDSFGFRAKLFRSSNGPDRRDEQDAAFVKESRRWFDSLWTTIARPFDLGH